MKLMRGLVATALALAMLTSLPVAAVAEDRDRAPVANRVVDELEGKQADVVADRATDRPAREPSDRPADRPGDGLTDHCDTLADTSADDRRCRGESQVDINVRKLIWRLIHAHEWEKLLRLLLGLGWL